MASAAAVLASSACGGDDRPRSTIDLGNGSGAAGGAGGGLSDTPFVGDGTDGGSLWQPPDADCVQSVSTADVVPVDLYMMFDQSLSMNEPAGLGSRLDAVRAAIADFVRDTRSEGLGLGVGYFGQQPRGQTTCDPADYSTPAVAIAPLPDNASAIIDSLNAIDPVGETPTGAALRGACTVAAADAQAAPDHAVAILLVTDGVPEAPSTVQNGGSCNPTLADATDAAAACARDHGIPTYVLGVGNSLSNLNQIADAGTTGAAQLVEGSDVTQQVLAALRSIRGDVVPCEFSIPDPPAGQSLDYDTVNVQFTPGGGTGERLYNVPSAADCSNEGGWFYDGDRTHILLCESTCEAVSADPRGSLEYALGCVETLTLR